MSDPLATRQVTLASGIELAVIDAGPEDAEVGDAPALIFLHGFPENHRSWRHQIRHLSDRFRCVAPEQRGYHRSSKPQDAASYTPDKLIGDVFQLADALGIGQFTVVGHDWGGAIAWGVAITGQASGRVNRAVVANAPHPTIFPRLQWLDPQQRAASQYFRTFRDPGNDALVREHGLIGILMKAFAGQVMTADTMEPEERALLLDDWQDREAAIGMLNWYRASPIAVPPADAPFALPEGYRDLPLPRLEIPTLLIWAMDDLALPPANLDGMEALVADLEVVRVPGCGHFVQWEAPEAVNAALDAFLERTGHG